MADTTPLAPTDAEIAALIPKETLWEFEVGAEEAIRFARAVLARWGAQQAPAGYALVPVEATGDMKAAAVKYANGAAVYKNVSAEVLRIEEGIYGEVYAAMLAAAPQPVARKALTTGQLEAAAKVLAASFDYPWDHMPEKGRETMRGHVRAVIDAATAKP